MLVLSRKCGERIVLPEQNIVVTVAETCGGQVRLGISTPDGVPIYRQKIWAQIQELTAPVGSALQTVGD